MSGTKNRYECPLCNPKVIGKNKIMREHMRRLHPGIKAPLTIIPGVKVPKETVVGRNRPRAANNQEKATKQEKATRAEIEVKTEERIYDQGTYKDQFMIDPSDDDDSDDDDSDDDDDEDDDTDDNSSAAIQPNVSDIFLQHEKNFSRESKPRPRSVALLGESAKEQAVSWGLLGRITHQDGEDVDKQAYLNTDLPFAAVTVGVQGAGKSHTLSTIIECCMLPQISWPSDVVQLEQPMTTLVFHFDQNPTNVCEATGLIEPSDLVRNHWNRLQRQLPEDGVPAQVPVLDRSKLLVLCSPTYYHQRKQYYGDYCEVRPLLFPWKSLTAKQIKTLMRIDESGTQLYVASMLDLLRRYQRENLIPNFADFIRKVESSCSGTQISPLKQRQALLESIILESDVNAQFGDMGADLHSCMHSGMLVVADLTDPLLSPEEANGIFEVLLEQFRAINLPGGRGKLLALDEAHKFMSTTSRNEGLSKAIVDTVRLMRHEGIRVAISSQNPQVLAPELLELLTIAIVHKFHSQDWYTYLKTKIPLKIEDRDSESSGAGDDCTLDIIRSLPSGQALVFAANSSIKGLNPASTMRVSIRPRLTADRGASRVNSRRKATDSKEP